LYYCGAVTIMGLTVPEAWGKFSNDDWSPKFRRDIFFRGLEENIIFAGSN